MPTVGISIGINGDNDFFVRNNRLPLAENNTIQLRNVALISLIACHVKRNLLCHRCLYTCYQGQHGR